jgi:raffinose/stachyose/melibiose transport system permease protein
MKTQSKRKLFQNLILIIMVLLAIYTLAPLAFLLVNSFKSSSEIVNAPIALPQKWSFEFISNAMNSIHYIQAIGMTFLITVSSVLLLVVVSSLCAWAMVRCKIKASTILFMCFTASMLIPFQSVIYPLLSEFDMLGLKNLYGLIIMYGGFGLSMSVFLYHGFLKSVPLSLEEAAILEGANTVQMFFSIVFPLVKGITVTVIILNTMWIWNDYLLPFLVIGNEDGVKTLTLELYFAKLTAGQYGNPWELIFPAVFVTIIPIIILYIFLQKYIIKGVADGAVK